jgi:hypothetical protein
MDIASHFLRNRASRAPTASDQTHPSMLATAIAHLRAALDTLVVVAALPVYLVVAAFISAGESEEES